MRAKVVGVFVKAREDTAEAVAITFAVREKRRKGLILLFFYSSRVCSFLRIALPLFYGSVCGVVLIDIYYGFVEFILNWYSESEKVLLLLSLL